MKVLIPIFIGLLVVGCGKEKQSTNTNEGNNTPEKSTNKKIEKEIPSKGNGNNSSTANPVKELTINDVVGSYYLDDKIVWYENDGSERFEEASKQRFVFLDNGVGASYLLLMDPREFLKDSVKGLEKRLVNSTKEFGKDNVTTKAFAEMLAEEKEKLAAAGPPEFPKHFGKEGDYKWEIKDGEVHLKAFGAISVYKMEPNGDLTPIRVVHKNGHRMDIPKEKQKTLKKIK